jgi:disulfide bond formation protein DsbB
VCEGAGDDTAIGIGDLTKNLDRRPAPRCDQIAWSLFGLSMAAWNAIISLGLAAFAFYAVRAGRRGQ